MKKLLIKTLLITTILTSIVIPHVNASIDIWPDLPMIGIKLNPWVDSFFVY